jgi:SAM-dependent methyltransferase
LNWRISGDYEKGALAYWMEKYFRQPFGTVLSLGCGFGGLERGLVQTGWAERVLGLDVSAGAIEGARLHAEEAGLSSAITYKVVDLDNYRIAPGAYDAIFAVSSIHHVTNLENLFKGCGRALKPGGLLFLDEYIGPSRWQYSDEIMEVMNDILRILPGRYRRLFNNLEVQKGQAWRPSVRWFEETDPSESVRSAEIVPILQLYFDLVDFRPYGGAILHILLSGIAGNFQYNREEDVVLLKMMNLLEDSLERFGAIKSDFAAMVARPKALNFSQQAPELFHEAGALYHPIKPQLRMQSQTVQQLRTGLAEVALRQQRENELAALKAHSEQQEAQIAAEVALRQQRENELAALKAHSEQQEAQIAAEVALRQQRENELAALKAHSEQQEAQIAAIFSSRSWRVTAPLRRIKLAAAERLGRKLQRTRP